jgi:hypothetical protein
MRRRLRAILHNAAKTGLAAQNLARDPRFAARVVGSVEFVAMLNEAHGADLKDRVRQLRPDA